MRRAETITRAPSLRKRSRSVSTCALAQLVEANTGRKPEVVSADADYWSEANAQR